ncbi:hypothetical protein ACU5B6_16875 [Moritella viscosa]|uniref:hypothetical protein n=1 Tax=Moritella viscosa TaxID=80854 RepID=UPI00406BE310
MVIGILKKYGPCLSSELAERLVDNYGLTPAAARKRISRSGEIVKKLGHLPFPKKARFIYLQENYASPWYWKNLHKAIYESGGAYSRALGAVLGRTVLPIEHFRIACGAPIAQKKHISADTVLERLIAADVLVKTQITGLGCCVVTKSTYEYYPCSEDDFFIEVKGRLAAEAVLIDSVKEWLKRLGFASYHSVKARSALNDSPMVGTFSWDITAPSYMSGLTTWKSGQLKPGFVVCDVLLNGEVDMHSIDPFLYKVSSTKSLRNVGSVMFIFVAQGYSKEAFSALKTAGVIPATPQSLFGKDVAEGFKGLIHTFENAMQGNLNPDDFNNVFEKLGKLEGALGNMRGTFFEFLSC